MCLAQKCPVCDGCGTIPWWSDDGSYTGRTYKQSCYACHACDGKGYVVVPCACSCLKEMGRAVGDGVHIEISGGDD